MSNNPQPLPLASFYPRFAKDKDVKADLKRAFGHETPGVLARMIAATLTPEEDASVDGIVTDAVLNGYDEATFYGQGSFGYFPITIKGTASVYLVKANEFDDIGYFPSVADARAFAEVEYESYGPFVEDADEADEWSDAEEPDDEEE